MRFALPAWLGVGVALKDQIDQGNLAMLQDMYYNWPFFQSTIDLVEMVMAKSDLRIAKVYDDKLITDPTLKVNPNLSPNVSWPVVGLGLGLGLRLRLGLGLGLGR